MTELVVESIAHERVEVGDGISIPTAWDVIVTGEPGVPGAIRLHGEYDDALRRAVNGRPVEMTGRSVNVTVSISRANVSEAEAFHDRLNAAGQRIDRARRTAKINETAKRPRAVA